MVHGGSRATAFDSRAWLAGALAALCLLMMTGARGGADGIRLTQSSVVHSDAAKPASGVSFVPARQLELPAALAIHAPATRPAPQAVLPEAIPAAVSENAIQHQLMYEVSTPTEDLRMAPIPSPKSAVKRPRILTVEVTAYCACKKCCGSRAQGLTSTGKHITYNGGRFIAADTHLLPYGTKVIVPGYADDKPVEVIDRGGAIRGYHIDIFMPNHQQAVEWGKKWLQVTVVE